MLFGQTCLVGTSRDYKRSNSGEWGTAGGAGTDVDVSSPASVARLASAAPSQLGGPVDVWINNAGYSGSFQAPPPPPFPLGVWAACWRDKTRSASCRVGDREEG